MSHWLVTPIIIPLAIAALQLFYRQRPKIITSLSGISSLALLINAVVLVYELTHAGPSHMLVYRIGGWPAQYAIVLVADYLSVLMVLISALLFTLILPYALGQWAHRGTFFQPLIQLMLVGLNGAFLTGDLFNLFVFFEVLLAASYGLALHSSTQRRVGASLHYITINLAASMLFLVGLGLIYGVAGTVNMAALAEQIAQLDSAGARALIHTGTALLALAFLTKSAIWPLGFWLPRTYAAAAPPVAALFSIMTKVGLYVLLRLTGLLYSTYAGQDSALFGHQSLLVLAFITLVVGTIGMLGAQQLAKLAGYYVLISSATVLGAIALHQPAVTAGALAYMVVSILSIAALFLLIGLIIPEDEPEDSVQFEPYDPNDYPLYTHEDERPIKKPAPVVILSSCFFICALLLSGMPPLSGFLAKFALLAPMFSLSWGANLLFGLILCAGLGSIIALCRAGILVFWSRDDFSFAHVRSGETATVISLLAIGFGLSFIAGWPWSYLVQTAEQIYTPSIYIHSVLGL